MVKTKKILAAAVTAISTVAVVIIASWVWLSRGPLDAARQKVLSALPFPAALVEGRPITMGSYITRYRLAQNFAKLTGQTEPPDLKSLTIGRLIEETEVQILAARKAVSATGRQIDSEYLRRAGLFKKTGGGDFALSLRSCGISQADYKNNLIKSDVTAANLSAWFYGQAGLNPEVYARAGQIIREFQAGASFGDLAKKYSQDQQSRALGGDLGFVELDETLPEVQDIIKDGSTGAVRVIPTRYGIEIVKVEGQDNGGANQSRRLRLRQIFLNGADFTAWYDQETKNLKIIKFVKI